jgi:hypothetical protein
MFDELRSDKRNQWEPDRVTFNILVKALVYWDLTIDTDRLVRLFNALVAQLEYPGDPIPLRTHSSSEAQHVELRLGRLEGIVPGSTPINFQRHVRPLYRLFIRAFLARSSREPAVHLIRQLGRLREENEMRERERMIRSAIARRNSRVECV